MKLYVAIGVFIVVLLFVIFSVNSIENFTGLKMKGCCAENESAFLWSSGKTLELRVFGYNYARMPEFYILMGEDLEPLTPANVVHNANRLTYYFTFYAPPSTAQLLLVTTDNVVPNVLDVNSGIMYAAEPYYGSSYQSKHVWLLQPSKAAPPNAVAANAAANPVPVTSGSTTVTPTPSSVTIAPMVTPSTSS